MRRCRAYDGQMNSARDSCGRPAERRRILSRLYRLDPAPVGRFYAGRPTLLDKLRIPTGKPPVPIGSAIRALGADNA